MKNRFFLFGLLGLFAISCVREQQESIVTLTDEPVFYGTVEDLGDPSTRVYADDHLRIRWDAGDRISIFNKTTYNREYAFQGETGDNSGSFKKVPNDDFFTGNDLDYIYAVYPYQESTKISDDGELTITLPAEQYYRENSFGLGANTMISVTEDNELHFKNVCGYFAVKLYGDNVSVKSISIKGNNNELLTGKATVIAQTNDVPTLQMNSVEATKELTLTCSTPVTLGSTAETATTFWFVIPPTTFENGFTLTVMDDQNGSFAKTTSGSLQIKRNTLKRSAALQVMLEPSGNPVPEAVDLGLSVKWASFNIGATRPEDYGDYYAWGETEPHYNSLDPLSWKTGEESGYTWSSYKWCNGSQNALTKYNTKDSFGVVDNKTTLDPEDDAAHVNWGENWRMPTLSEVRELFQNCTFRWTTENGIQGSLFTSNKEGYTDKSIFFPASGRIDGASLYKVGSFGYYWSSSLDYLSNPMYESYYSPSNANYYSLNSGIGFSGSDNDSGCRYYGYTIRPVFDDQIHPISITLNKTSLSLFVGRSELLIATISPADATDKTVIWSSDNTGLVTVDSDGFVTAVSAGLATITATTNDGNLIATCAITVYRVPEAIDLGLSVKWASFNLGSPLPEGYGEYYAWGETEPYYDSYYSSLNPMTWKDGKNGYTWTSYKWCVGSTWTTMTKYCTDSSSGYNGFMDGKTVLDPEDDAALVKLGGKWRMPTDNEWTELRENCTWTWTTQNSLKGMLVTAPNGNSIFLPAAGYLHETDLYYAGSEGYYWSCSLYPDFSPYGACIVYFRSSGFINRTYGYRCDGLSVRPVCP